MVDSVVEALIKLFNVYIMLCTSFLVDCEISTDVFCVSLQGLYKEGERFGPGIATYVDGTCDVGLWHSERLIKLCSVFRAAEFSLILHGHHCNHDEHRKRIPKVVHVRSHLDVAARSAVSLRMSPEPPNYRFESDSEDIAKAVISDLLPVSSLAADLHSYDEAFFTCSKSFFRSAPDLEFTRLSNGHQASDEVQTPITAGSAINDGVDANLTSSRSEFVKSVMAARASVDLDQETEEENILAWNNTASCIAVQTNILRHRSAQSSAGFDVDSVIAGERVSTTASRGVIEIASEEFIVAAGAGDLATVSHLLVRGEVNVDVADSAGHTALFAAVVILLCCCRSNFFVCVVSILYLYVATL